MKGVKKDTIGIIAGYRKGLKRDSIGMIWRRGQVWEVSVCQV